MKNIAIIGSGIAGLTCGHLLNKKHQVTLFEKNDRLGGHTATVDVTHQQKSYALDTGFIVFNDRTYPNFINLLNQLGVEYQNSEMSFSVTNQQTGLEYNGHNLNSLFAQRQNLFNPKFWRLLYEIMRFNRLCNRMYKQQSIDKTLTLGEFLRRQRFSSYFAQHYILPMGAAIWSTSIKAMEQFQLLFFIRFFVHHGLLNINDRPQWHVVTGGSRVYIQPMIADFKEHIELNSQITAVQRDGNSVIIEFANQPSRQFDEVIFACHADQALALLAKPSSDEQRILGALPYSSNQVVLHTDSRLLPRKRNAWASWNYLLDGNRHNPATVTYNLNILQNIDAPVTFCVTLNQTEQIDPSKILYQSSYDHPVYDVHSEQARARRLQICGHNHSHFVGAYWYNGFHEDGVLSAIDVARRFDCDLAPSA